jgi:hypothetical protein
MHPTGRRPVVHTRMLIGSSRMLFSIGIAASAFAAFK